GAGVAGRIAHAAACRRGLPRAHRAFSSVPGRSRPMPVERADDQQLVVARIREYEAREVMPVASGMERRGEYPHRLVETMKTLGLFGLNVPDEYGGNPVDYTTFARVFEELSRGWMALAGIIGTHLVLCDVLLRYGTDEQK